MVIIYISYINYNNIIFNVQIVVLKLLGISVYTLIYNTLTLIFKKEKVLFLTPSRFEKKYWYNKLVRSFTRLRVFLIG